MIDDSTKLYPLAFYALRHVARNGAGQANPLLITISSVSTGSPRYLEERVLRNSPGDIAESAASLVTEIRDTVEHLGRFEGHVKVLFTHHEAGVHIEHELVVRDVEQWPPIIDKGADDDWSEPLEEESDEEPHYPFPIDPLSDMSTTEGLLRAQGQMLKDANTNLETTIGLLFRSQVQMHAMFDRATHMVESYAMRFGLEAPGVHVYDPDDSDASPTAEPVDSGDEDVDD